MDVRFSSQHKSLRNLIEAIPEEDWTPIPYWMDGAADVAETTYTPFQGEPGAAPVRLIVRRVKPTPGSQLALFATYSYHGFITDRDGETLELEADHRRHAEIENAIRDLKYGVGLNHMPSGRFAANAAWLAIQVMAHNLARWTARTGLGEQVGGGGSSPSPDGPPARHPASPPALALGPNSVAPWPDCEPFHSRLDGAVGDRATHRTTEGPRKLAPPWSASGSFRVLCPHLGAHRRPPSAPPRAPAGRATSRLPESSPDNRACNFTPFRCPHAVHLYESVDSG